MSRAISVHVLILAGGLGTRLRSVVSDRPKVLAEVGGRPFITYLLDQLAQAGFQAVTLLTGYRGDMVEAQLGLAYGGIQVGYSVEESPLGTGGAIRAAARVIACDQLLVLNGDTFFVMDYRQLVELVPGGSDLMACRRVADVGRYGAVQLDPSGGITALAEKSAVGTGLINGGIYVLNREAIASWPETVFSIETDYFPKRMADERLLGVACDGAFIDIGVPDDLLRASEILP
jgi:D-glycero-alpha-D-manno-heptose 1-phosphate guanylyltransferase